MVPDQALGNVLLYTANDKFYLELLDGVEGFVTIDRLTSEVRFGVDRSQIPVNLPRRNIFGVYGTFETFAGPCLVVVTEATKIGKICGQSILRIDATEIIPYARTNYHISQRQAADDAALISMVKNVLDTPHHYFSLNYDLTHSMQRLAFIAPEFRQMSMFERADDRFVWNYKLIENFVRGDKEVAKYSLPVIHGFISIKVCSVGRNSFNWAVISRRSRYNAGTRFYTRGINLDGHVANFVETEQIVEYDGQKTAFVQTRGSIPLFWNQLPNLKYKPSVVIDSFKEHILALTKHFEEQVLQYGQQVLLNLVDQKGSEGRLASHYKTLIQTYNNDLLRYEAFDFHHECRRMRWDRLSILIDRISQDFENFGYLHLSSEGLVIRRQEGTFRTNCIDCLDRTNVVQSMLAHKNLEAVLERLGILSEGSNLVNHKNFEYSFKNVWADNADFISCQYSGTGALKTDYTRTGKRTKFGALKDGYNSLLRYYKNNFADGFRQDAIDFFHGHWTVDGGVPVLSTEVSGWKFYLPIFLLLSFGMWFSAILLPDEYSTEVLLFMLFWAFAFMMCLKTILRYGNEFVNKPRLVDRHRWPK
ncbi:phosphatidylinositol-3-phosphatase SAC1-like [Artemia franciscana]|uniref:Phosphatidylinositol-3-phosphatase SAC1 n=1 Tax=Artemia franciscana TaxID=6661 RepID=A0AA88LCI8_ARTSF|nr:hypothetical protein QYM36_000014 [Artemia franciscana]